MKGLQRVLDAIYQEKHNDFRPITLIKIPRALYYQINDEEARVQLERMVFAKPQPREEVNISRIMGIPVQITNEEDISFEH